MKDFRDYKPGIPKRYLLFLSAVLWTAAGIILWVRGTALITASGFPLQLSYLTGFLLGLLFYFLIFARLSFLYTRRIFNIPVERPCAFSFFSVKSYLLMLVMIAAGILLRFSGTADLLLIGIFYLIMACPLLLSSLRFWYFGFRYPAFTEKFSAAGNQVRLRLPRWQRRARNLIAFGTAGLVLVVILANWKISAFSKPYIFESYDRLPVNKVGVVPGTSNKAASGQTNLYFFYRLRAAATLYKAGKVQYLIVSGDNRTVNYNEPLMMKRELIRLGVPDSCIIADYAGRRTFDSVIRAWKIFGQRKFTFISQHFQNERAVFIARHNDIEAIAFNAEDVSAYVGFKTRARELLARVKVFIDAYILHQQPEIMGEPETIP